MKALKLFLLFWMIFDSSSSNIVSPPNIGIGPSSDDKKKLDEFEWVEIEEGLISAKTLAIGAMCAGGAALAYGARKIMNRCSTPKNTSKKVETKSTVIKAPSKSVVISSPTTEAKPVAMTRPPVATKTPKTAASTSASVSASEPSTPSSTPVASTPAPEPEAVEASKPTTADIPPEPESAASVVAEPGEEQVEGTEVQVPSPAVEDKEDKEEAEEPSTAGVSPAEATESIPAETSDPEIQMVEGTEAQETSPVEEKEDKESAEEPSTAGISPGGATESTPTETSEPEIQMEIAEAEPVDDLPDTPFTSLFGSSLVKGTEEKGKLEEVHTAAALAGKTVAVLFHGKSLDEMLKERGGVSVTPKLAAIYALVKGEHKNFEMVYCGLESTEGEFVDFFHEMPWLSILPYDAEVKRTMIQKFDVQTFPGIVVLDENGEVINNQAMTSMLTDPDGFPWEPQTLTEILGTKFVDNMGNDHDIDALQDKVIGLYFSAHWCPPCRQFTPMFAKLYESLKAQGKDFEVIYVSNDKDEETYNEYLAEMPWLAVPYADVGRRSKLQVNLGVGALPTLIIVDKDGTIINNEGRAEIVMDPEGDKFPWYPKPLKNLAVSAEGLGEGPAVMIFAEGASEAEQSQMIDTLGPIAESSEAAKKPFKFFYAVQQTQVTELLRKMCGLEGIPQNGDTPVMVVLDLEHKSYAVCDERVNQESIQNFLTSFESKDLKMTEVDVSGIKPPEQ